MFPVNSLAAVLLQIIMHYLAHPSLSIIIIIVLFISDKKQKEHLYKVRRI